MASSLRRLVACSFLMLTGPVVAATAAPKGFQIYPFPALVVNDKAVGDAGTTRNTLVSDAFLALYDREKTRFNVQTVAAIRQGFSELAIEKILKADRERSLVASMHVVRARHYAVSKPNGTSDIYVPVTGALYFTNPVTTEVVLAVSHTAKPVQNVATADIRDGATVVGLYEKAYAVLLQELVRQAKEKFQPKVIETTIVDTPLGLGQTSIGLSAGLAPGDTLLATDGSAPIKLLACEETACVGSRTVGAIAKGSSFIKRASGKTSTLAKPSVFVRVDAPEDALEPILGQMFSENLGETSPFNVVYVNPDFQYLINGIAQNNEISLTDVMNREPADMIIDVALDPVHSYKVPTNLDYKWVVGQTVHAVARVVDRNGNLLFSVSKVDAIDDEVTGNIDFSAEDRAEISTKNVLVTLAEAVTAGYKAGSVSFPLALDGSSASVADPGRLLRDNKNFTVFRKVPIGSSQRALLVPLATVKVGKIEGADRRSVKPVGKWFVPQEVPLSRGDAVVVANVASSNFSTDREVAMCGTAENRGSLEVPNMNHKVFSALSRGAGMPFVSPDSARTIDFMVAGTAGFRKSGETGSVAQNEMPGLCLKVLQRIDAGAAVCDKGICQLPVTMRMGVAVVEGGEVVAQKAVEQRALSPGFGAATSAEQQRAIAMSVATRNVDSTTDALVKVARPAINSAVQGVGATK